MQDRYDESRQRSLLKKRNFMKLEFEKKKKDIVNANTVSIGPEKFVNDYDIIDDELKKRTVGLVKLEDFQKIKQDVSQLGDGKHTVEKKKRRLTGKPSLVAALSFDEPGDDSNYIKVQKKLKKNPLVDTSFLPDSEREAQEQKDRERLEKVWLEDQERIKNETIVVSYSYWDGTGHRRQVQCKKGDTIGAFLAICQKQFPAIAKQPVERLMYVKEDLIIPHDYTFYDFIINKTRGKSGPLFDFSVKEDVRLLNDATVESSDSHAGKMVERTWYERNKHIFPASRWEPFDPNKDYGKYKIKG